jgi:hypothetical protein
LLYSCGAKDFGHERDEKVRKSVNDLNLQKFYQIKN